MKLHIEGFSQAYAATLKEEVTLPGGKTKVVQIDCTDLVILRWFVDFYPAMKKTTFEDGEYAWLVHSKLKEDLPILDISARACTERMQKLVKFKLLKYRFKKDSTGTFSYYTFGENFMNLQTDAPRVQSNADPVHVQTTTPSTFEPTPRTLSNADPVHVQTCTKDNSIIDTSIKDNSTIDRGEKPCSEDIEYIIGYLNQMSGFNYSPGAALTGNLLIARWAEGYRREDFMLVIKSKVREWKGNAKMQKYLRPQTLFSENFESYINTARSEDMSGSFSTEEFFNAALQRTYTGTDGVP